MHRESHSQSDAAYVEAQAKDSSWSSQTDWGEAAANKFIEFGKALKATGQMYHDDTVADFGGNDGYAANEFFKAHAIKPLVVDCEPHRLDHADKVYGLSTYQAFLEDMHELADDSIDWGFCSHTLEHMRDPEGALREMARVIKRGCFFVIPIENEDHATRNEAHAMHADSAKEWCTLISRNGWRVVNSGRPIKQECYVMAKPR